MKRNATLLAIVLLGSGLVTTGQQPATPVVFTAAQAEAGRTAYENTCGKCHTYTLLGRKGEEGEYVPGAGSQRPHQALAYRTPADLFPRRSTRKKSSP